MNEKRNQCTGISGDIRWWIPGSFPRFSNEHSLDVGETTNWLVYQHYPDEAGRKFQARKNLYKPKKEFASRMHADRPTSAMPNPIFLCAPAFTRSVWVVGGGELCFHVDDVMCCGVMWLVAR